MGPGSIYRNVQGLPCLYVRSEQRPGSDAPEHLLVNVHDRTVFQQWVSTTPDDWECVHDTAGRGEASLAWRIIKGLEQQRDACFDALKYACDALPPRVANEVRNIYNDRMRDVELVSL